MASPAFQNGGVLFFLWDEGTNDADDPPLIVASPNARHGYFSQTAYDTSAYLLTIETILGLDPLPCSAHPAATSPMRDLFATALPSLPILDGGAAGP